MPQQFHSRLYTPPKKKQKNTDLKTNMHPNVYSSITIAEICNLSNLQLMSKEDGMEYYSAIKRNDI